MFNIYRLVGIAKHAGLPGPAHFGQSL
jgi:hypothetical protein